MARKTRLSKKNLPPGSKEASFNSTPDRQPPVEKSFALKYLSMASMFLLIIALFCFMQNTMSLGVVLVGLACIAQVSSVLFENRPPWLSRILTFFIPVKGVGLLFFIIAIVAFGGYLLTFENFTWLAPPKILTLPFQQSFVILLICFLALVGSFRLMPQEQTKDFSSWTARFWLFVALGITAVLGLHHADWPVGSYWEDMVDAEVGLVRRVAQLHDYRGAFIFGGIVEPFYDYFEIFMFRLFPDASSLFIQRLSCVLMDMGTVWVCYLLGKELVDRKTGVFAAAAIAVSKPLLFKIFWGIRFICLPLGTALALLFFFRVLKKPSLKHFLQWGVMLALGAYTYSTFRPFVPFFIFLTFGWVLLNDWKNNLRWIEWGYVGINAFVLLTFLLYTNNFMPSDNFISRWLDASGAFLPSVVLCGLFLLTLKVYPKMIEDEGKQRLTAWIAGSWVCILLCYPVMASSEIIERMRNMEHIQDFSTFFDRTLLNLRWTLQGLFFNGADRSDMNINQDAFFSYSEDLLAAIGLAYALARPNLWKGILILSAFVGIAPHFASAGAHSGRELPCIVPLFILGAAGLTYVWDQTLALTHRKFLGSLLASVLLICFWLWSAGVTFDRSYDQWAEKYLNAHITVRKSVLPDEEQGNRVYLESSMLAVASVIYEGHPVFRFLENKNRIYLDETEKTPTGVVIYTSGDSTVLKNKLQLVFPQAQWKSIFMTGFHSDNPVAYRCALPFSAVKDYSDQYQIKLAHNPKLEQTQPPLFEVVKVSKPYWDRLLSPGYRGMTWGWLADWDKVNQGDAPFRPDLDLDQMCVRYLGSIHVNSNGRYDLLWALDNRTWVKLDGKRVLDISFPMTDKFISPPAKGKVGLTLTPGYHSVEVDTCFQFSRGAPDLALLKKGGSGKGQSLWSSFEF